MVRGPERAERGEAALRREAANRMILSRHWYLSMVYGTADHAGYNPALWKPYHVTENRLWTQAVEKVFNAAFESKNSSGSGSQNSSILANLEQDDLPAMLIAASYFYPDFNDLEHEGVALAHQFMTRAGVFRQRDFDMVDACINATVDKERPDALTISKSTGEVLDFRAHKKVFVDAIWGCNHSLAQTPYLVALLGAERLIENKAIRFAEDGQFGTVYRLPQTLAEVIEAEKTMEERGDPRIKDKNAVLKKHINKQNEIFFGKRKVYTQQLDRRIQELSYRLVNKKYFQKHIFPMREESSLSIANLLQITREESLQRMPANSRHEWVATLN